MLSFVDIDQDGDQDCFIGNADGKIKFFENTAEVPVPVPAKATCLVTRRRRRSIKALIIRCNSTFTEKTGSANPFSGINVGKDAAPLSFVDIDQDGDQDAFIGKADGKIKFFDNTGSSSAFQLTFPKPRLRQNGPRCTRLPDAVDSTLAGGLNVYVRKSKSSNNGRL